MVRRGQVRDVVIGSRQIRVLVISGGEFAELSPWGLLVDARKPGADEAGRLLVALQPDDPRPGEVVQIPTVLRFDPTAVRTDYGFLTNETMNAVERGLRMLLELA